ncbi:MAG: ComEC/Rec2 family competence protein [Dehalococcoidia bacterium]|nr:ComEC/Rec2 family competence protein [Dehalococcoidia bacterium]
MLLTYCSIAWLAGIWAGPSLLMSWEASVLVSFPAFALGLVWKAKPAIATSLICGAVFAAAAGRYQAALPSAEASSLPAYHGQNGIVVEGWVSADPEVRDKTTHLRLEASAIKVAGAWRQATGAVLVYANRYPQLSYGEVLRVSGKLETPEAAGEFDYPAYLARQGIYSTMVLPSIQVLNEGGGTPWMRWLLGVRSWLAGNLVKVLPEPQAALAQGMLLGIRSSIPQDLMDAFSYSGTAHIIVISGQNLTLLAGYMLTAGQALVGRRRALWLSLAIITFYTLLVGAQPPVLRADIMCSIFILGTYLGRQRQALIALAFSAAVMTAFQPLILWDVSFQLSFAATAGLMFIAPSLQRRLDGVWAPPAFRPAGWADKLHRYVVENLAVTIGATAAVLPLLLVNFQRLSLISPAANLLLLPALPGVMLTGALAAGLGLVPVLGQIAGWVAWPFLTYMTSLAKLLAGLPLASIEVAGFEPGLALIYYAVLCLALAWVPGKRIVPG